MFLCEALWVCLVYEKCYINKVALPPIGYPSREVSSETIQLETRARDIIVSMNAPQKLKAPSGLPSSRWRKAGSIGVA